MQTVVIATRNRHKVLEIQAVLGAGPGRRYLTLADLPSAPVVAETAATFAGNAELKALGLARWLACEGWERAGGGEQLVVLADDSGLEVDALGGAPGVHSARFAALTSGQAGNASDAANNAKLLGLLAEVPWEQRTARFRCVVARVRVRVRATDAQAGEGAGARSGAGREVGSAECFEGVCEGRILVAARGQGGFGYDPLFQPLGHEGSFAELGEEVKNRMSHRARALAALRAAEG